MGWTEGRLRLSASAFRSGDINVIEDECAELWFGNAFLTALGDIAATRVFDIELAQLDARWSWAGGAVGAFGGTLAYDDDDTTDDNARDAWYGALEVVQDFRALLLYGAARYSWIRCSDGGYRVLGQGGYNPDVAATLADEIDRLSLGVGSPAEPAGDAEGRVQPGARRVDRGRGHPGSRPGGGAGGLCVLAGRPGVGGGGPGGMARRGRRGRHGHRHGAGRGQGGRGRGVRGRAL